MDNKRKIEVDYYDEISIFLKDFFISHLPENYTVHVLVGEISSALRTLIANGYEAGELLNKYSKEVHRLHLDISVVIENNNNSEFEVLIFEIKKTKSLGLQQLSQLIGYCLVSGSEFGVLVNVDNSVSNEFSVILDADKNLTSITRIIDNEKTEHKLGVMIWNSRTKHIDYTEAGCVKNLNQLVELVIKSIN